MHLKSVLVAKHLCRINVLLLFSLVGFPASALAGSFVGVVVVYGEQSGARRPWATPDPFYLSPRIPAFRRPLPRHRLCQTERLVTRGGAGRVLWSCRGEGSADPDSLNITDSRLADVITEQVSLITTTPDTGDAHHAMWSQLHTCWFTRAFHVCIVHLYLFIHWCVFTFLAARHLKKKRGENLSGSVWHRPDFEKKKITPLWY